MPYNNYYCYQKKEEIVHAVTLKKTGRRGVEEKIWNKNVSLHFLVLYAPCSL